MRTFSIAALFALAVQAALGQEATSVSQITAAEASAAEALRATAAARAANSVEWDYCMNGPSSWAQLDDSFAKCSEGLAQSPINIAESEVQTSTELKPLSFQYKGSSAQLVNTGHVLSVSMDPGSILTVDGDKQFELLEVRVHVAGQHQVNGKASAAEFTFVHKSSSQDRVNVAVRAEVGEANAEFEKILKLFPKHAAVANVPNVSFNPNNMLPASKQYYAYGGSQTAPPCSEGVHWKVLRSTITIGAKQLEELKANIPNNARPAQPLHGRSVTVSAYAEDANGEPKASEEAKAAPSTDYSFCATGPGDWAALSPLFSLCGDGEHQSPINIVKGSVKALATEEPLRFHIENAPLIVENAAKSIQITSNGKSRITANGKKFTILQTHFSTPSGHLIDGVPAPMEMSLTAKAADNQLLILSVLLNEGEDNAAIAEFVDHLPRSKISVDLQKDFDLAKLLPKTAPSGYYHYSGSLSAPPCSENVERYVLQEPIAISKDQIKKFQAILGHNARPTQLLYGRTISMPESGFINSGKDEVEIKTLADQAKSAVLDKHDLSTDNKQ